MSITVPSVGLVLGITTDFKLERMSTHERLSKILIPKVFSQLVTDRTLMTVQIPGDREPRIYQEVSSIETPALTIDLDVMERNMDDMISWADSRDVSIRSHVKGHKVPEIAHIEDNMTGGGICCQKLGEVEVFAQSGLNDIYLVNIVVEKSKLERIVWISEKINNFQATVDGAKNARMLNDTALEYNTNINVILEVDIGFHRTGVAYDEAALQLADRINNLAALNLDGILAYDSHIKREAATIEEYKDLSKKYMDKTMNLVDKIPDNSESILEVKTGSTVTAKFVGEHPVVTEINPGRYPFFDGRELQRDIDYISMEDCSLTVLTQVVSKPNPDKIVVDAGRKAISYDYGTPIPKKQDVEYLRGSSEHLELNISDASEQISVGDKLELIPPLMDTTVNLYDNMMGVRNGVIEEIWEVQARGKLK